MPAWKWVGVSSVVEVTGTSHALSEPAGVQQGDLLVAIIGSRIASASAMTLPTGGEWTLVTQQNNNNTVTTTSALPSGTMAYCVRGASAPNLTFTHPTAPSVALGRIVAYRYVNRATPKDTQTSTTTGTNVTSVSVAGLTTANANELIVTGKIGGQECTWSVHDAATDPTTDSGTNSNQTADPIAGTWQERADSNTTTGADMSLAIADAVRATAGATGNITATASQGSGHVVMTVAFIRDEGPNITPSQGNLAISGTAPTVQQTLNVNITVPQGNLALSPTAPSLGLGIKPPQGNVVISGTAPTAAIGGGGGGATACGGYDTPIRYHRGQKRPWSSIPRINWDHPLARGLVMYHYDAGGVGGLDLAGNRRFTIVDNSTGSATTIPRSSTPWGTAYVTTSGSVGDCIKYAASNDARVDIGPPLTFAAGFFKNATASENGAIFWGKSIGHFFSAPYFSWCIADNSLGTGGVGIHYNDNGNPTDSGSISVSLNAYHSVVGSVVSSTIIDWWVDGIPQTRLTPTNYTNHSGSDDDIIVLADGGGPGGFQGSVFWGGLWNRVLTAGEARQLQDDPYCFLIYPEDEFFSLLLVPAAAGGGVSITVPQGNLAISSVAPSLGFGFTPAQGNLALSSVAPLASVGTTIQVPQGNLTLLSVALTLDFGLKPAQGNLVISSVAPKLDFGFTPAQGNLTLSSVASTLGFGFTPAQGNLAISSVAPSRVVGIGGNLTLSSVAPTLDLGIRPPQGNLVLSPTAPDVQAGAGVTKQPPSGNLIISSVAPTLDFGLKPAQGNLTLSSVAPSSVVGVNRQPLSGNLVISSTAPSVGVSVPQGNLIISSVAPTVVQSITAGQLVISSVAPLASVGVTRQPPAGQLAISSVAPNVVQSITAGQLVLSPTAPSLDLGIRPAQGNLALSSVKPTVVQSIPQGNLTISSVAPTVAQTFHRNVVVPQGDLVLSSTAPSAGGNINRTPLQGNLAISGTAPVVTRIFVIVPAARDLVISSVAPTVFTTDPHPITTPQGNLRLTALPPQLTPGVYFFPDPRDLVLSTTAPVVTPGRTHHWRRPVSLIGDVKPTVTLQGSVVTDATLEGEVVNTKNLEAD